MIHGDKSFSPSYFRSENLPSLHWDHKFVFLGYRVKRPQLFLHCATSCQIKVKSKIGLWLMATSSPAEVLAAQWSLPWEWWRSFLGVIKRWSLRSHCFSHIHSAVMFVTGYFRLLETCVRYEKMEWLNSYTSMNSIAVIPCIMVCFTYMFWVFSSLFFRGYKYLSLKDWVDFMFL